MKIQEMSKQFWAGRLRRVGSAVCAGGVLAVGTWVGMGETVIIESRVAGGAVNSNPPYAEQFGNWQNSSVKSTAEGLSGTGSRFNTAEGASFTVSPQVEEAGGEYFVELTFSGPGSQSDDIIVQIDQFGCSGLPATTDLFQQPSPALNGREPNTWIRLGKITFEPGLNWCEITFTHISGVPSAGAGRFYFDAIRFINASDPCLGGLASLSAVNGPLAAGNTEVAVPGVSAEATAVSVYANGELIGVKDAEVTEGVNVVTVSPLGKGEQITVTQTDGNGVESCRPEVGTPVGGGANTFVRLALSVKQDAELTGPIGSDGGTGSRPLKMLGATGPMQGFGTAPDGDKIYFPEGCWQTVTFERDVDPSYAWAGGDLNNPTVTSDFAVLDAIAFAIADLEDSGPYRIYIDNLKNGSTVIEDFEGYDVETPNVVFRQPSFSGSTSPYLLAQSPGSITPNVSMVTDEAADTGNQSLVVEWQFVNLSDANWLRLVAQGVGTPNPVLDMNQPISFRMLLLPVGESEPLMTITEIADATVEVGGAVSWTVDVIRGTGPFTYQWMLDGEDIPEATEATFARQNLSAEDAGDYSVRVTGQECSATSTARVSVVDEIPLLELVELDGQPALQWSGSFILQSSATVDGDYEDVAGAGSPHPLEVTAASQQFFRLRGQ